MGGHDAGRDDDGAPVRGRKGEAGVDEDGMADGVVTGMEVEEGTKREVTIGVILVAFVVAVMLLLGPWIKVHTVSANNPTPNLLRSLSLLRFWSRLYPRKGTQTNELSLHNNGVVYNQLFL